MILTATQQQTLLHIHSLAVDTKLKYLPTIIDWAYFLHRYRAYLPQPIEAKFDHNGNTNEPRVLSRR